MKSTFTSICIYVQVEYVACPTNIYINEGNKNVKYNNNEHRISICLLLFLFYSYFSMLRERGGCHYVCHITYTFLQHTIPYMYGTNKIKKARRENNIERL